MQVSLDHQLEAEKQWLEIPSELVVIMDTALKSLIWMPKSFYISLQMKYFQNNSLGSWNEFQSHDPYFQRLLELINSIFFPILMTLYVKAAISLLKQIISWRLTKAST